MFSNRKIWLAYLIVFISSTCGLVIELVAGRIMAPYIGVSLYTWTSIIGVVLAGISLGNYLGGVVADRRASRSTLGLLFLAGGLASAGILSSTAVVTSTSWPLPLVPKIVFLTTAIFFLPSLILGMVSPVVIKLALQDLGRTGNVVGSIYAFSTVGSIFGTFITGFWLISWLGTRTIVWAVALLLVGMGVVGARQPARRTALGLAGLALFSLALWLDASGLYRWFPAVAGQGLALATLPVTVLLPLGLVGACFARPRIGLAAGLLVFPAFGLVYFGWDAGLYKAPCQVESNYYCIRTDEQTVDGHPVRALVLDHLVHSYVSLDDPGVLGYGYERVYDELTTYYASQHGRGLDTLFIGGGGYTFPRYIEATYPEATIDVLEIDPAVTQAAHDFLGLPADTRVRSFDSDARAFLMSWEDPKKFDIVYGDAFNDLSVPYHLTTVEFDRLVAGRLKDDGLYMVNVIDKYEGGEFMKAFANSLREVFPHVYLLAQGKAWLFPDANTYILLASRAPLDVAKFEAVVGKGGSTLSKVLPDAQLDSYLSSGRAITLTDDYVPVDQLVAPLFIERGF
ncbi:MAG: fused MFS/spermidine synthase [Dehalococcoidales bacterium]|nr:fused MFS/spermidine synthase [Dehalococcoidales bacterium]